MQRGHCSYRGGEIDIQLRDAAAAQCSRCAARGRAGRPLSWNRRREGRWARPLRECRLVMTRFEPGVLGVELVRGCNFSCANCLVAQNNADAPERLRFMPFGVLETICREMDRHPSIATIWLFNHGEPLAHPQFRECLELVYRSRVARDATVILHTNASLLDGERADALLEVPVVKKLTFSFDGYGDKESYELMRGTHYDRVLSNIREFAKSAVHARPDLTLATCTVVPRTNEVPGLKEVSRDAALHNLETIFNPMGVAVEVRPLYRHNGIVWTPLCAEGRAFGGCIHVERDSLFFTVTGKAAPCCNVYNENFNVGSVLESGMAELLNNETMAGLRHALRLDARGDLEYCSTCTTYAGGFLTTGELRHFWKSRFAAGLVHDAAERAYLAAKVFAGEV